MFIGQFLFTHGIVERCTIRLTSDLRFDQVLGAAEEAMFVGHRGHYGTVWRQRRTGVRVVVLVFVTVIVLHVGQGGRSGRLGVSFRIPVEREGE